MLLKFFIAIICTAVLAEAAGAQGSTAATGRQLGYRTGSSWQNATPFAAPGNADAGLGRSFATGTQGAGGINSPSLPQCNTGLNAIHSGFNKPAVHQFGTGGFSGGGPKGYGGTSLPPCALTPCDLHITDDGGGGGSSFNSGGGGNGDPYGFHQGGEGADPYGFHQGDGGFGSGGNDPYGFHQGGAEGTGNDPYSFHGGM